MYYGLVGWERDKENNKFVYAEKKCWVGEGVWERGWRGEATTLRHVEAIISMVEATTWENVCEKKKMRRWMKQEWN